MKFESIKRVVRVVLLFSVLLPLLFACKHNQGNQEGEKIEEKELFLDTFKVGDNVYQKDENKISVTTDVLNEGDIKGVVFKDASGNNVENVAWKMKPDRIRLGNENKKIQILVTTPPKGYKAFESAEITVIKELVAPKVTSITVHGAHADISKTPFVVRSPKPTVTPPTVINGQRYGDILVQFDKVVEEATIRWEGLPSTTPLVNPEDVAHVKFKVPAKEGAWLEGEYKLDIIFDTPSLSIKSLKITDQDGDTELNEPLKPRVNLKNSKDNVIANDVKVEWMGEFIDGSELSSVQVSYEGLPLNGLEVGVEKTFKIKVAEKPKKYKAFEATIAVMRANKALVLKSISLFGTDVSVADLNNLRKEVDTLTTFIKKGDIKAKFTKPDHSELDVVCELIGDDKLPLNAGVENEIGFRVPATKDYAEYRGVAKITHKAEWDKMIKLPIPDGGVTFKTGLKDEDDVKMTTKVEIGQFPVSYKLWNDVCDWAISGAGSTKGYQNVQNLKKYGQNGCLQKDPKFLNPPVVDDGRTYPATSMTYHSVLVWCNIYSEMKGYAPVYYKPVQGKIDVTYEKNNKPYTIIQRVTVDSSLTKDQVAELVLRDPLQAENFLKYTDEVWNNIRDNYVKVAMLTAKDAKFDDNVESGFRLIQPYEWQFAGRLTLTKHKYIVAGLTFNHEGKDYYFANKDCAPGSMGYGEDGSEIEKVAWISANSQVNGKLQTHPIGTRRPTDLGIYDLAGNIGSWTNFWEKATHGDGSISQGETKNDYLIRAVGGGFADPASRCVLDSLGAPSQDARFDLNGLRLARTLK